MFLSALIASVAIGTSIPRDIHADAPDLANATRGLVRDAQPRLAYDMGALASYDTRSPAPVRLDYAGYDRPGQDWRELEIAHQIAADIVYAEDVATAKLAENSR